MTSADEPVDRNPDADRRPIEPEPQAEQPSPLPEEIEQGAPWISEETAESAKETMFPAGPAEPAPQATWTPAGFSDPEEVLPGGPTPESEGEGFHEMHLAGPAETVHGRPGDTGAPHAIGTEQGPLSGAGPDIRISGPAEKISDTKPVPGGPKPRKKRLRPRVLGSTAVVVLLGVGGVVSWNMGLIPGGKQGPEVAANVASTPQPPAPKGTPSPTPGNDAGQTPAPGNGTGQKPEVVTLPAVETVIGVELIDPKRLTGSLSEKDRKTLGQLTQKITTDREISQADLDRVTAWMASVAPDCDVPEVKQLRVIMRILNGNVAAAAGIPGAPTKGDAPSRGDKGASRVRPSRNGLGDPRLGGSLSALSGLGSSGLFALFLAADEPAAPEKKASKPPQPAEDLPPDGLSADETDEWKQSQEFVRNPEIAPLVRAAAFDKLKQLCKGDTKRAEKYAKQAQQIREETARETRSPKERSVLREQTERQEQLRARQLTLQASAQAEEAAKRAVAAAEDSKKSADTVSQQVTAAKAHVDAARSEREALEKSVKAAQQEQAMAAKAAAEAALKDQEALEKSLAEARAQAAAAKKEADAVREERKSVAQLAQETKEFVNKGTAGAVPLMGEVRKNLQTVRENQQAWLKYLLADLQQRIKAAESQATEDDAKKLVQGARDKIAALAAKLEKETPAAELTVALSESSQAVRDVEVRILRGLAKPGGAIPADMVTKTELTGALDGLKKELEKLAGGPVGQAITAEQLEKIVGEVANRVSAAVADYDWQSPVVVRGPLGRIRQWYYPPASPARAPQVAVRSAEASPQGSPGEAASAEAPAQTPGQPAAASPQAPPAAQQFVDAKLKALLEPSSQEPNPLLAGEIFSRGATAYFLGEAEGALDYFVAAVRQDPKNALYRYYLGLTLRQLGRPAEAEIQVRAGKRFESPVWRQGIGVSLQRVQGPDRDWLERLRLEL